LLRKVIACMAWLRPIGTSEADWRRAKS